MSCQHANSAFHKSKILDDKYDMNNLASHSWSPGVAEHVSDGGFNNQGQNLLSDCNRSGSIYQSGLLDDGIHQDVAEDKIAKDESSEGKTAVEAYASPNRIGYCCFHFDLGGSVKEHHATSVTDHHETTCWGCGLRLFLSPYAPVFKCGWCGAITNQNPQICDNKCFWWRRLRDRCFVCILIVFILFVIGGGVWAIYPVIFSISLSCGVFHSIITIILSITTISTFSLAAFRCPGAPPSILWGSYPAVGKGGLDNYTFCHYCSKPKSHRTHHCRSCGMCVLDMDHHCPFIGNCVGAANHRCFIFFLISAVISTIYVSIMSTYVGFRIWPPLNYGPFDLRNGLDNDLAYRIVREIIIAFLKSAVYLSARGLVLVYLFFASVSVGIGLSVLLWQQLCYIYEGKTYLGHLSSQESDGNGEKDCQNISRFFGCPYSASRYLPSSFNSKKRHEK